MSLIIIYRSSYLDVDVFSPREGWNEEHEGLEDDESELRRRSVIARLTVEKVGMDDPWHDAYCDMTDTIEDSWFSPGCQVWWDYGRLRGEKSASNGEVMYVNDSHEFYEEMAEFVDIIPECINSDFCLVKAWENSGQLRCEVDGDFDIDKIRYDKGMLYYGDVEFGLTDRDGISSSFQVYRNGIATDC